jgi:hypothetical protein
MSETVNPAGPKPSPAKMLSELSNTTTLKWVGVALLIHVVVFGLTSINYLRTAFTAHAAESQAAGGETPAGNPGPAAAPAPSPAAAKPSAKTAGVADEAKEMESHKDSPVVKSITTVPKPGELPKGPAHSAMDLDGLEGK